MSRLNSFYLPPDQWPAKIGDIVEISGDEAKHMLVVLRTELGQTVRIFDGCGRSGIFKLIEKNKKKGLLEGVNWKNQDPSGAKLTLAIGWGKSKRRNYLFEKTVELRGEGLAFWEATRSQGHMPMSPKETWQDKCIQAAKQCGAPYLPEIEMISGSIAGLIAFARGFDQCYLAWESDNATELLSPKHLANGKSLVVIGPEGGMEPEEADQLINAGFQPVTLGKSILRWETAATYCLSLAWFAKQE